MFIYDSLSYMISLIGYVIPPLVVPGPKNVTENEITDEQIWIPYDFDTVGKKLLVLQSSVAVVSGRSPNAGN